MWSGVVGGRGVCVASALGVRCVWCGTLKKRGKNRMWIPTRNRVYIQNVPVCTGNRSTCINTCGRAAGASPCDFKSLRTGREQHVPDSSNHSPDLLKSIQIRLS